MIVMTDNQFALLMDKFDCLIEEVRQLKENLKPADEHPKEEYGIRPDAIYADWEVQKIFQVSDKTTRKWRNQFGLKFHQKNTGEKGSRITYEGRHLIEFYKTMAPLLGINKPKPIKKDVPKGHQ